MSIIGPAEFTPLEDIRSAGAVSMRVYIVILMS